MKEGKNMGRSEQVSNWCHYSSDEAMTIWSRRSVMNDCIPFSLNPIISRCECHRCSIQWCDWPIFHFIHLLRKYSKPLFHLPPLFLFLSPPLLFFFSPLLFFFFSVPLCFFSLILHQNRFVALHLHITAILQIIRSLIVCCRDWEIRGSKKEVKNNKSKVIIQSCPVLNLQKHTLELVGECDCPKIVAAIYI